MHNQKYSLSKIVATLGPASEDEATIRELIANGMSVARINCSHGDWVERAERIATVRRVAAEMKRAVAILVDLQGPKIRTGDLPKDGVNLKSGEKVILTTNESKADYNADTKRIHIRNYPELCSDVSPGQRILLDDGLIRLAVLNISEDDVDCEVHFGGILKSNKGVNLPESKQLRVEAITEKDKEDLIEGVKVQADFIALSFVRRAEDIISLKELIKNAKEKNNIDAPIKTIAKIEKPQALDCIEAILDEVDGVMVARGDLGVEVEPERVPLVQKEIISKANIKKKLVITATQMMDSMIRNPFPTRAEVSDVANAIIDGTDAVMLSGETAAGKFPGLAVDYMRKIALEIEGSDRINVERWDLKQLSKQNLSYLETDNLALAQATYNLALLPHIRTIVAFSCSGRSVQLISKLRPAARIIAATTYQHTYNYLSMVWGVTPVFFDQVEHTTKTMINIEEKLIADGIVQPGETIIITGGLPIAARSSANFIKLHQCNGSLKELTQNAQKADQAPCKDKGLGPTITV